MPYPEEEVTLYTAPAEDTVSEIQEAPTESPIALPAPEPTEPAEEYTPKSKPFVIEMRRVGEGVGNHFRPKAAVLLTPALRTSGLLALLPDEEFKSLLCLLTFVNANGDCLPTLSQIATALGIPEGKAKARLERLQQFQWQGSPLVYRLKREMGLDAYTPSGGLLEVRETPSAQTTPSNTIFAKMAGRESVVAHSRARYARNREEVEREIAERNGWEAPPEFATEEEKERNELQRRLCLNGIPREQANEILEQYPAEKIRRQLDWLPYRGARYPAGFLVSAIAGDYEAPPHVRSVSESPNPSEASREKPVSPEPLEDIL